MVYNKEDREKKTESQIFSIYHGQRQYQLDEKIKGYYSVKNLQANCVCENSNFYYKFYVKDRVNGMRDNRVGGGLKNGCAPNALFFRASTNIHIHFILIYNVRHQNEIYTCEKFHPNIVGDIKHKRGIKMLYVGVLFFFILVIMIVCMCVCMFGAHILCFI